MRSEERQDDGLWERKWKRWMNEEEKRTKFFGFRWRWEEGDQVLKQIWIGWMDARECDGRRHEAMTGEHAASTARRARPSSCLSPSNLGYVPFRPLPCSNTSTYQVSLILPHPIWPGTLQPWAFTCPRPSSPHTRTPSSGAHTCATDTGGERNKTRAGSSSGGFHRKPRRQEGLSSPRTKGQSWKSTGGHQ